ncbi:MAG: tetratricopeptide repeat protein, partial [Myxococcota bacterium]
ELVGALVAWLGLRTRVRPLVVVLDTPDDELAELVAATSELPVLWLLVDAPFTAEGLTVPPLASGAQVEALQTLLPLSPELAGRLVDGTQGDVGLARRRLRGWAVRDALRPSSRGWILRSGVSALPDVASDPVAEDAESERLVLLGAAAAHGFGDYHRVLRLLDRLDPPPPEARWRRAMALCMLGDLEGAERSADAALQSASGADRIAAHRARASVHVRRGERDAAVALLEAAQHVPASGEQAIYARVELASAYVAAGRTADARRQLAIEIRGGTAASIVFDITRGRLHMGEAELEPARAAFERAMETAIGLGARTWEAIARLDLAVPLRTLQGPEAARTSCMRAVAILDQVGHVIAAASARLSLAWIDALDGESRAALAWIDEAVPRLEGVGHETLLAAARLAQLLPLAALGAWSRFDATIEAVREVTDPQHRPVLEMLEAAETLLVELPDVQRGGWVRDLRTRLDPRP